MPKPFVVVTRKIPQAGLDLLRKKGYKVKVSTKARVLTHLELKSFVKGADAILSLLTDTIDAAVIRAAGSQLKIVANYAVGYDNIDINALKKQNVRISNTPGVLTNTVADMTVSLILALARRIPEADLFTKQGRYKGWEPMLLLGSDIYEKTLGIVGAGRIGTEVARRAQGFKMRILYYDLRGKNKYIEDSYKAQYKPFKDVLKKSDFLTLHVPLFPSTRHLIGVKELTSMKQSAFLINTSRGPVVDEKELTKALERKIIAGAALDVFEREPKVESGLKKMNNVILTPHISSASVETRSKMAVLAARNIIASLSGKTIPNEII